MGTVTGSISTDEVEGHFLGHHGWRPEAAAQILGEPLQSLNRGFPPWGRRQCSGRKPMIGTIAYQHLGIAGFHRARSSSVLPRA